MSIWRRLFGQAQDDAGGEPPAMPWDRRPSILEFVRSHVAPDQPGVSDEGLTLPDEERINGDSQLRWAAGAMDGVATHHVGTADAERAVKKVVKLVVGYSRKPTAHNKAAVYQHILAEQIVSIIDPVIEALVSSRAINHQRLYDLAYSFVTEAPDREPVKLGIALLGLFRQPANEELFQTLGRHDEFTLYCAVALANSAENPEVALWTLARNVTGWGRIHVVERLAQTTNAEIKRWLLCEGFRNSILNEYLAATCARAGDLPAALRGDQVDRELLTGAGEIIEALIAGGPAEGIDDYEDARPVLDAYLDHMTSSAETVGDLLCVCSIQDYLGEKESRWEERYQSGWTAELRDRLRGQCEAIEARPGWSELVRAKLASQDEYEFARADYAAKALGIDTWDIHWRRLQENPHDAGRWYQVMHRCDDERIDQALEFASETIDLAAIATGASDKLGLGREFEQHSCLDFVVQDLRRFPGRGRSLIEAGLQSPVVRNRNMAITALECWPRAQWPPELEAALKQAMGCEPNERVRAYMQKVLQGEPPAT